MLHVSYSALVASILWLTAAALVGWGWWSGTGLEAAGILVALVAVTVVTHAAQNRTQQKIEAQILRAEARAEARRAQA